MGKRITDKWLGVLLITIMFLFSGGHVLATDQTKPVFASDEGTTQNNQEQDEQKVYFKSISGVVQEIESDEQDEDARQLITLKMEDGAINRIMVTAQTYAFDEVAIGSEMIAFYDVNKPMILIYPPQYTAEVIALVEEDRTIKVDRFNKHLISADGMLKLNISEQTKIIQKDGTEYTGDLAGCDLAVEYRFATRSIPAQTTPEKIVVLNGCS